MLDFGFGGLGFLKKIFALLVFVISLRLVKTNLVRMFN